MALTIGESIAVQRVTDWLTSLEQLRRALDIEP